MIRKSFSLASTIVGLGACTLLFLACAASPSHRGASAGPPPNGSTETPSTTRVVEVADPLARWSSRVRLSTDALPSALGGRSESAVGVESLPGYVHVQLPLPPRRESSALHCFVYDELIHPGEGVDQMLRAIAPGVRFLSFSPLRIEALHGEPLIEFTLSFRPVDHEGTRRSLGVLIHAREQFPVVCSVEEEKPSTVTRRLMREFVSELRAAALPDRRARWELFAIESPQENSVLGFVSRRSVESDGELLLTERLTSFHLSTEGARNRDRVVREAITGRGDSKWVQWFELFDGQVVFRGQVAASSFQSSEAVEPEGEEQEAQMRYRFGVQFEAEVKEGHFVADSAMKSGLALSWGWPSRPSLEELVFQPYLDPLGPSRCQLDGTGMDSCFMCRSLGLAQDGIWPFEPPLDPTHVPADAAFRVGECGERKEASETVGQGAFEPPLSSRGRLPRGSVLRLLDSNR